MKFTSMVCMGGPSPAWTTANPDDVPDGWLITEGACPKCEGSGKAWVDHDDGHGGGFPHMDPCGVCYGTGFAEVEKIEGEGCCLHPVDSAHGVNTGHCLVPACSCPGYRLQLVIPLEPTK